MSQSPKVVEFKREDWRDIPLTLRTIAAEIEAGDFGKVQVASLVLLDDSSRPHVFGAGLQAGELQVIAALTLGQHELARIMTGDGDGDG